MINGEDGILEDELVGENRRQNMGENCVSFLTDFGPLLLTGISKFNKH